MVLGSWSGDDIWNGIQGIGNAIGGLFNGEGSIGQFISDPAAWWDHFKNGNTNSTNLAIENQNLEYQKERNEIEDERYQEETDYNRAFAEEDQQYNRSYAEEQRDYERALQQQIFEREDTALERQAKSLSSMGINPLSQQLNGLNAGQAISSSLPGQSVAPGLSNRGGSSLHNNFRMQDQGMLPIVSAIGSLASVMNGISTGQYQRDSLALQNDRMYLENMEKANSLGIKYAHKEGLGDRLNMFGDYRSYDLDSGRPTQDNDIFTRKNSEAYYKSINDDNTQYYKYTRGINDSMSPNIRLGHELANLDFSRLATDIMTNILKTKNDVGDKIKNDFGEPKNKFGKFIFDLLF